MLLSGQRLLGVTVTRTVSAHLAAAGGRLLAVGRRDHDASVLRPGGPGLTRRHGHGSGGIPRPGTSTVMPVVTATDCWAVGAGHSVRVTVTFHGTSSASDRRRAAQNSVEFRQLACHGWNRAVGPGLHATAAAARLRPFAASWPGKQCRLRTATPRDRPWARDSGPTDPGVGTQACQTSSSSSVASQ
jgi:hypothetical protein